MNSVAEISTSRLEQLSGEAAVVIYDGDCPFCSRYVQLLRLRDAVGQVTLIDARDDPVLVRELFQRGFDLDDGMLLIMRGQFHHGADCINRLALMSTGAGWFNSVNALIFRSRAASRFLYPPLRAGRNLALFLLNRRKLHAMK